MKVALLSSRPPSSARELAHFLHPTFALARQFASKGDVVVSSLETLPYEAAARAAFLAGGRLRLLITPSQRKSLLEVLPDGRADLEFGMRLPRLEVEDLPRMSAAERDAAVVSSVDLAVGVAVRAGGTMEGLLRARFLEGRAVAVVSYPPLYALPAGNQRLLLEGVPPLSVTPPPEAAPALGLPRELPYQLWHEAPFTGLTLAHFTRARRGPWPGQLRADWLDELEAASSPLERSALSTLRHLCEEKRIRGSGRLIRGGFPMVSLTALKPEQLESLFRWRRHLLRWDFEPVGLVFEAEVLVSLGARRVIHAKETAFAALPEEERPFFQKLKAPGCDYRSEEEWRIYGDLDLTAIPPSAIRAVVGKLSDASWRSQRREDNS